MKTLVVVVATISVVCGIEYDGLRVKFGWSDALADIEYFFKIPRTSSSAESEGWRRTERPPGPLLELRMYCPQGRAVCPLFDAGGFVAGLQIALPVDEYESLAVKPEKKLVKWRAPALEGEPSRDYWTLTQYFVSEESLKAGAGPQVENGATLQDGGVWVTGLDGRLMRIPSTEAELNSTAFKKQNCVPNMGCCRYLGQKHNSTAPLELRHQHGLARNYYNMTPEMKCEDALPWFALVSQGDLIGSGFQIFGRVGRQKYRDWFERPTGAKGAEITVPFAPPCLYEWVSSYGIVSLHIYYVDKPWNIKCRTGDSVKPAPALDRLMLNGYRYANQVADEVKKLFSG